MQNYIIANKTDVGKARQVNEDSLTTFDSPNGRVIAVCDGMGGQAAGDVASRLACDVIRDILENNTFGTPFEAITNAMLAANQAILHRVAQNPDLEGMGATCVMIIIKDGKVYYGWVGDSRIYELVDHTLHQLSKDQSYVQMLVDQGEITPEEAETHPQKNEITNALGLADMTPPTLCDGPILPKPGSIFMLCSDGLTNMVGAQQIARELNKEVPLQEKADKLVFLANQYGGADNITVQLVEFGKPVGAATAPRAKADMDDDAPYAPAPAPEVAKPKKSPVMAIAIALLVVLVGLLAYLAFAPDDNKDEQPVTTNSDTRDPSQTQPAAPQATQPTQSTRPSASRPAASEPRQTSAPNRQQTQNPKPGNTDKPGGNGGSTSSNPESVLNDNLNQGSSGTQSAADKLKQKQGQSDQPTPVPQTPTPNSDPDVY